MSLPLLGPQMLLHAYACGLFPMAASYTSDRVLWVDPEQRGILPLHRFHVSRSMKRVLKKHPFDVHIDRSFERVVRACAERCEERHDTWLTPPIQEMHLELYKMGHAHSGGVLAEQSTGGRALWHSHRGLFCRRDHVLTGERKQ